MKWQDIRFLEDPRFRSERLMWIILATVSILLIGGVGIALYLQHLQTLESLDTEEATVYTPPPQTPLTPEQQALRTVEDARQAFMNKDFAKSRELLSSVDLEKLQSASAMELAGRLQLEAGAREAALISFNKGLEIDPSPGLLFQKALLLRETGKLKDALTTFLAAQEKAPNDPVISNECYLMQIQLGQIEKVTADIEERIAQTGTLGSEFWVVALAGIYLEKEDFANGARFLKLGKNAIEPAAFRQLLQNPILLRHQGRPEIFPLYLENL